MAYRQMSKKVRVVKIDNDNRLYIRERKITYIVRIHGRFIAKFSGVTMADLLESPMVNDVMKERIRETLKNSF